MNYNNAHIPYSCRQILKNKVYEVLSFHSNGSYKEILSFVRDDNCFKIKCHRIFLDETGEIEKFILYGEDDSIYVEAFCLRGYLHRED